MFGFQKVVKIFRKFFSLVETNQLHSRAPRLCNKLSNPFTVSSVLNINY